MLGRLVLGWIAALGLTGRLAASNHAQGTATSTPARGTAASNPACGTAASAPGTGTTSSAPVTSGAVAPTTPATPATSAVKLLGQRIMVGLTGTTADAALLREVRDGAVGSVILFAANIVSRPQTLALTGVLQRAARQGGNPPLLIAVDQEGGQVKRLPSGPPDLSPPQIAAAGSATKAFGEGRATGR